MPSQPLQDQVFVKAFMLNSCITTFSLIIGSTALKCISCSGDGATCRNPSANNSRSCPELPPTEEALCGRVNFKDNGTNKVMERCTLKKFCIGTIDCLKDGFELGKAYPGASGCVVSCCEGDDCNPKVPLRCHKCKGQRETCSNSSVSCGFGEDRCIRISYKVNGNLMVDERCYKSSRCTNTTEACDSVQKDYPDASDCKPSCCKGDLCNNKINKACSSLKPEISMAVLLVLITFELQ